MLKFEHQMATNSQIFPKISDFLETILELGEDSGLGLGKAEESLPVSKFLDKFCAKFDQDKKTELILEFKLDASDVSCRLISINGKKYFKIRILAPGIDAIKYIEQTNGSYAYCGSMTVANITSRFSS